MTNQPDNNAGDGLDIAANRKASKWSARDQLLRILWGLAWPLFRLSPRPLWGWRRGLLRLFGARIGREVHIYPTARIDFPWHISIGDFSAVGDNANLYALGEISIGSRVTISKNAHLCAGSHDYSSGDMRLLKPPIFVADEAWICADAFVGPGVNIGARSIVGARAVAVADVEEHAIVGGNPARLIKRRPPIA